MKNPIQWVAVYGDDDYLKQYDGETENAYQDIERDRLKNFNLTDGQKTLVSIALGKNQRIIYRKRTIKRADGSGQVIYLAGWQETVNGKSVQSIIYLLENGTMILAGEWGKAPLNEPEYLDFEQ